MKTERDRELEARVRRVQKALARERTIREVRLAERLTEIRAGKPYGMSADGKV